MPVKSERWKVATNSAFGANDGSIVNQMAGSVHRDIEVLILYPMNLVAVEERFGSWMTQYAYANYLTAEKLLEMGEISDDGYIKVGEKKYHTLVTLFEPLPSEGLLKMMNRFAEVGGQVIWCGPPPLISGDGKNCSAEWQQLFGVNYAYDQYMGEIAAGRKINFQNSLAQVAEQTILTDFLVDRIYPVTPDANCEILAKSGEKVLGTGLKKGKGMAFYFGFRPRDDQSASLGYETKTLFEILNGCGAYASSGKFPQVNDNPTVVSRTTDYLATRYPNNTTVIVKHYRTHAENWEGGFSRSKEADDKALSTNPMPSDTVIINDMKVNGHQLTYNGRLLVAFRTDQANQLIAFEGHDCTGVVIDGTNYAFSQQPFRTIVFAPVNGQSGSYMAILAGEGKVQLPNPFAAGKELKISTPDNKPVTFTITNGKIELDVTREISGTRLRIVES